VASYSAFIIVSRLSCAKNQKERRNC
jgi:hypothetical protein